MIREKQINCLDVSINHIDEGSGVPIVFIHNGGGFWQSWIHQIEYFRTNYRVIALDLPGFGESGESTRPYTLEYYAEILEAFLDHLQIQQLILVGNCIGATLAINFKNKFPGRVLRLVLMNICPGERLIHPAIARRILYGNGSEIAKKSLGKILGFIFTRTPVRNSFPDILFGRRPDHDSFIFKKYRAKFKEPRQTRSRLNLLFSSDTFTLDRILEDSSNIQDALLIWGRMNKVAGLEKEGYYHQQLCGIENMKIIDEGGHLSMYEFPDQTNRLIKEYLES